MTAADDEPLPPSPSGPKRVTFLSHSADASGGAEAALIEILCYVTETERVIPHVILPDAGSMIDILAAHHIAHSVIPFTPWCDLRSISATDARQRNALNIRALTQLVTHLRRTTPDIAFTNTIVAPWLAVSAAQAHTPHIWMLHEFGDIDHKLIFDYSYDAILKTIDQLSAAVIVNSRALASRASQVIPSHKITQIYYAMADNVRPSLEVPMRRSDRRFRCLMLGRIVESKGQLDGVKAIHELCASGIDVELLIVGAVQSTDYLTELKAFIATNCLADRVQFVDFQPNPQGYVTSCDALLLCSENEAFGRATAEAMLLGKPVIGTNSGGTSELIDDGNTGLLYEVGDINGLARCIEQLVRQPRLSEELGGAARKWARLNFTHRTSEERIVRVLDQAQRSNSYTLVDKCLDYVVQLEETVTERGEELQAHKVVLQEMASVLKATEDTLEAITSSNAWRLTMALEKTGKAVRGIVLPHRK
jgi:glycosyltransferase involved in cell wall biosynthesis